jgi:hypothetical protein
VIRGLFRRYNYARPVNVCYVLGNRYSCETLSAWDAYLRREQIEQRGGTIFWFNPC